MLSAEESGGSLGAWSGSAAKEGLGRRRTVPALPHLREPRGFVGHGCGTQTPGASISVGSVGLDGEFIAAFSDRPEVAAFQAYLATDTWANNKAKSSPLGGWVSANTGLNADNLVSPIDKLAAETFQDDKAVFRFDGSDQMPAAVGSGAFWKQATAWVIGQDTKTTVDNIEAAWPKS